MQKIINKFEKRSTIIIMVAIFGLVGAFLLAPNTADAATGAVWTTKGDCGNISQDVNHFNAGEWVYINGKNFNNKSYNWNIKGKPGGASGDPGQIVANGSLNPGSDGKFCKKAYKVNTNDWGTYQVKFGNKGDNYRVKSQATVDAYKIICEAEEYLPNWGDHGVKKISRTLLKNFVKNSEGKCWFAEEWGFQWSLNKTNPGDNTGEAGGRWNSFSNMNPVVLEGFGKGDRYWFREMWNNNYVPFSSDYTPNDGYNDVSAEFYCNNDIRHYDNLEWIDVKPGGEYICAGFNAEVQSGSITGRKYYDVNMNGDFDQVEKDEPGDPNRLNDWRIMLFTENWEEATPFHVTGETGQKGQYRFEDLRPGTYHVCEANLSHMGWVQTEPASGEKHDGLYCHTVRVAPGEDVVGIQFGNYQVFDIHGYKWLDENANGERDCYPIGFPGGPGLTTQRAGETPIHCEPYLEEWTIFIDENSNGQLDENERRTNTSDDGEDYGRYEFNNLERGTYTICEVLPEGWAQSFPMNPVCHEVTVPNQAAAPVLATSVVLDNPDHEDDFVTGYNFGNYRLMDIHGYKWHDVNGNGRRDCVGDERQVFATAQFESVYVLPPQFECEEYAEDLLGGWTIFIDDNDNGLLDTDERSTKTSTEQDHMGWWWFEGLTAGEYKICEVIPEGWEQTYPYMYTRNLCHTIMLPDMNPFGLQSSLNAVFAYDYHFGNRLATDLAIEKSVLVNGEESDVAEEGDVLTYSITVSNSGDVDEYNFYLKDSVPTNITLVPNWGGDLGDPSEADDIEITWGPFDLLGHSSYTVTFDVTVNSDLPVGETLILNEASLWQMVETDFEIEIEASALLLNKVLGIKTANAQAAPELELVLIANSNIVLTTVVVEEVVEEVQIPIVLGEETMPALTVNKTVNVEVANPGQTITYTIVVANPGDAIAENVVLIDHIAPGLQFTDTVAPTHTWLLGDLKAGEEIVTTYDVIVLNDNEPGIYPNTAEVWATGLDNVYDTAEVEVQTVKVLGADTLPTTGPSILTYVYLIGAGLVVVFSGYVLKLTTAKK